MSGVLKGSQITARGVCCEAEGPGARIIEALEQSLRY